MATRFGAFCTGAWHNQKHERAFSVWSCRICCRLRGGSGWCPTGLSAEAAIQVCQRRRCSWNPQVWVEDPYSTKWKASSPIAPTSLAGLTKRDQVSLLLRVSSADAGIGLRRLPVFDDKQQLVAVGGDSLRCSMMPSTRSRSSKSAMRQTAPLQVSRQFAPASALAGRTVTKTAGVFPGRRFR